MNTIAYSRANMTLIRKTFSAMAFNALFGLKISVGVFAQLADDFFGDKLRPEIH